jgi:hypothetical protein
MIGSSNEKPSKAMRLKGNALEEFKIWREHDNNLREKIIQLANERRESLKESYDLIVKEMGLPAGVEYIIDAQYFEVDGAVYISPMPDVVAAMQQSSGEIKH